MKRAPREFRKDAQGEIRKMAEAEGYVMVRRPRYAPFVLSEREWRALPIATPKAPAGRDG